jgi:transposase
MALYVRTLRPEEQQRLANLLKNTSDPELTRRARIVLLSAQKQRVQDIGSVVGLHPINVRKWIHRFNRFGLDGLHPRRSPGRPRLFAGGQRQAIVRLATADPQTLGLGFTAWSLQRLRTQLIRQGIVKEISAETIRQELLRAGLIFEGRHWVRAGR